MIFCVIKPKVDFSSYQTQCYFSCFLQLQPSYLTSIYVVHFNVIFFGFHFFWHSSLTCCCLLVFSFFSSFCHVCLLISPLSHLFINSFILFFIFLTFFPVSLLLSSAKLNFKVLLNLCHIIKLYFFNQVLAIDHVIFVVTLIIEV